MKEVEYTYSADTVDLHMDQDTGIYNLLVHHLYKYHHSDMG